MHKLVFWGFHGYLFGIKGFVVIVGLGFQGYALSGPLPNGISVLADSIVF
jgi:hypothetical protein